MSLSEINRKERFVLSVILLYNLKKFEEDFIILKKIGPLSCGKVSGVLYGFFGLILGVIIAAFSVIATMFGAAMDAPSSAFGGLFVGLGSVIILPLFYGALGFIGGFLSALFYNRIAGWIGGVEVELEETPKQIM